jgi:hypothetical protein
MADSRRALQGKRMSGLFIYPCESTNEWRRKLSCFCAALRQSALAVFKNTDKQRVILCQFGVTY